MCVRGVLPARHGQRRSGSARSDSRWQDRCRGLAQRGAHRVHGDVLRAGGRAQRTTAADGGGKVGSDEPRPINRIETVPLITDWLTSLGVVDVRTRVLSLPVPCTDEFAWSMILGSGLRGALGGFSDDQRGIVAPQLCSGAVRQRYPGGQLRHTDCGWQSAVAVVIAEGVGVVESGAKVTGPFQTLAPSSLWPQGSRWTALLRRFGLRDQDGRPLLRRFGLRDQDGRPLLRRFGLRDQDGVRPSAFWRRCIRWDVQAEVWTVTEWVRPPTAM